MMFRSLKRALAFAPLVAAFTLTTACDDDPVEPEEHAEEVDVIRLTVSEDTIDITANGTDEDITIPTGDTPISATFFDADGDEVELHDDEFEVQIESDDPGIVTYVATDAFNGTLTGVSAGNTDVSVQLYHLEEGHPDFGPHDVNVIVE